MIKWGENMNKNELLSAFHSIYHLLNEEEMIDLARFIMKVVNRTTLSGELQLVDDELMKNF